MFLDTGNLAVLHEVGTESTFVIEILLSVISFLLVLPMVLSLSSTAMTFSKAALCLKQPLLCHACPL